jgi:ABC-type lipoprotein export system ATPase subunit
MSTLSPHTLLTRAVFGLSAPGHQASRLSHERDALRDAAHVLGCVQRAAPSVPHATLILLTGNSGSGKSSLLRGIRAQLSDRAPPPILNLSHAPPTVAATLIDHLASRSRAPWSQIAQTLTRLGLGQPSLWLAPFLTLSDGQRSRGTLADAVLHARAHTDTPLLLIDEFLSNLDRPTARSILSGLRRVLADSPGMCVVAATAHDDLAQQIEHLSLITHIGLCRASILFCPSPSST